MEVQKNDPAHQEKAKSNEISRRHFLDTMLKTGMFAWVAGMVAPAISYLWPVRKQGPGSDYVTVSKVDEFQVGTHKMVQSGGKPIIVIRLAEDKYRSFTAICTHLGCIVNWDREKNRIFCPCHAGFFDTEGKVISGPPPQPLHEYKVFVIDGEVRVKTGGGV
ncbi:MAG: Rieske (2Fe-2S) protein [Planctomycetes bacterium]|nr:Rieske (2Fe-2S) protein [Planctomycetota bacterium]